MRFRSHFRFLAIVFIASTAPAWPQANLGVSATNSGDEACRSCHAVQVESFHETAHFLTSRLPSEQSILGKFTPGENVLKTANPNLLFQMEAKAGGSFYQSSVAGTAPHLSIRTERFDVVIGSGDKGQTYLFWDEDQLFQLPVSYWRDLGWVNSPGYRDGFADFERAIIPRCLECHATDFKALPPPTNRYNKTGFTLGIQCEKCHGPGAAHIAERAKSGSNAAGSILNPAHFSRERQMDLCAWCHAGHGQPLKSSFSYRPGNVLDEYIHLQKPAPNTPLDVHGNQVELLKQSRCYLSSSMTCLTCHNVHEPQHDSVAFSQKCLRCHQPSSAIFAKADHPVTTNCIDCHMPKQETDLIVFDFAGKKVKPEVRTHLIKIYRPN